MIPQAVPVIQAREDASIPLLGAVNIMGMLPPSTKEGIDAIKAGKLLATGDFSGYLQGCVGMMAAIRYAHKLPVPKEIAFPAVVLDNTNYKDADIPDAERECPKWETVVKG